MTTTADLASWLACNVNAIARHESAGQCFIDIRNAVDAIERMINRPTPPKYCGPCPTPIEDDDQEICGVGLFAKWDQKTQRYDAEVTCWKCHTTYNADQLISDAIGEADGWLFTAREVLEIMAQIGEPLSERTWRHWRTSGKIQSRNEWGPEPKYYIEEVRELRREYARARAS